MQTGQSPSSDPSATPGAATGATPGAATGAGPDRLDASALAWALFQAARDPYVILCTIYVFAPYVVTVLFADPVAGQKALSDWNMLAGIIVALTAPFVGSIAERSGRRKPPLAAVTLAMVVAIYALWWAKPDGSGLTIAMVGFLITFIGVAFAWNEVLHNSLLPVAARPGAVPRASGLALALGNLASVGFLVFVLWGLAFPGRVDWPFVPAEPLFGLDPSTHETSRIVAPIAAVWLAIGCLPLFFLSRDTPATGLKPSRAAIDGISGLFQALGRLFRTDRNAGIFLVARMLYVDGKVAILIFAGVTAAGVFEWGLLEMSAYGVILSVFAVLGGLLAGWLDSAIGAKRAVIIEIGVTLVCLLTLTAQSPVSLFGVPVDPAHRVWDGPAFTTWPELVFLSGAIIAAVSITGAFASSRTLMARLAPPGMEGVFFGLYAMAGAATAWLGPMLVGLFTAMFQSQQAGLASTGLLLGAGLILMLFVRQPPRLDTGRY